MDRFERLRTGLCLALLFVFMSTVSRPAVAQPDDALGGGLFDLQVEPAAKPSAQSGSAKVSASLKADPAKPGEAILAVTITLSGDAKTYGIDPTSPRKTKVTVNSDALAPVGEGFLPDREPKITFDPNFKKDVGVYTEAVTYSQRFAVKAGATPVSASGTIDFLFCNKDNCIPKKESFTVTLASDAGSDSGLFAVTDPAPAPAPAATPAVASPASPSANPLAYSYQLPVTFRGLEPEAGQPVLAQFSLSPDNARDGETVTVSVRLLMKNDWHTYSVQTGEKIFGEATHFEFDKLTGLELLGDVKEVTTPKAKPVQDKQALVFYDSVVWQQDFKRVGTDPISLEGMIRFQLCEGEKRCLAPKKQTFAFGSAQTPEILTAGAQPVSAAGAMASTAQGEGGVFDVDSDTDSGSLWSAMVFAFLGGMTLNIMPCVLPVLAIKILSIVQQAGESRGRILFLNSAYTVGVISVFATLATLAAVFRMGWGQQFQHEWFRVATVLIVFVCGLNLLGVFEILLPGMLSQVAGGGDHREGPGGAFMTGIFATLLATPCSTGYMASALTWSVKQSTPVIYLVWCTMGLGMALPYLMIGLQPRLINWLPRPGMWMVQFKQLSAFAMFGAAVWFLQALDQRNVLPVLTACVGLGLGLWMIGTLYDRESTLSRKSIVRVLALASSCAVCSIAFWMHVRATAPPSESQLPWVAFDEAELIKLRQAGKPVLIDFTADWCAICKQNEHLALNTVRTADFVRKHGVVTMMADYTNQDASIEKWLNRFQQISVPLTVIIPPDPNAKLIPLSGAYSESRLIKKLEQAMGVSSGKADDDEAEEASGKMVMAESVESAH